MYLPVIADIKNHLNYTEGDQIELIPGPNNTIMLRTHRGDMLMNSDKQKSPATPHSKDLKKKELYYNVSAEVIK